MKDIGINTVVIGGTIVDDCDITGKNANIAEFTVEQTVEKKKGDKWEEESIKWPCKMFSRDSNKDTVERLNRGEKVVVCGSVTPYWKDEENFSGYSIWINSVRFFGEPKAEKTYDPEDISLSPEPAGPELFDDTDIPF